MTSINATSQSFILSSPPITRAHTLINSRIRPQPPDPFTLALPFLRPHHHHQCHPQRPHAAARAPDRPPNDRTRHPSRAPPADPSPLVPRHGRAVAVEPAQRAGVGTADAMGFEAAARAEAAPAARREAGAVAEVADGIEIGSCRGVAVGAGVGVEGVRRRRARR